MFLIMLFKNRENIDPQKLFTEMSLLEAVMGRREDVNHLKFFIWCLPSRIWLDRGDGIFDFVIKMIHKREEQSVCMKGKKKTKVILPVCCYFMTKFFLSYM